MKQKTPTAWKVTPKSIDVHLSESPLAGQIPICKIWIWWIFYKMKFGRFMNFTAVVVFSLVFQSIYNIISTLNILISCFSRFIEHPVKRFEGICIQDGQLYDQRGFKGFLQLYFSKLCNQVPSLNLSRWRTLTLEKIKTGWVLWCIKLQTIVSYWEEYCESVQSWLLSQVWNIETHNLFIFSTG